MGTVNPADIVLAYLHFKQEVSEEKLIMEINEICKALADKGVYTAIDFTFYKHRDTTSDVIHDILWGFTYSSIIAMFSSSDIKTTYIVTKYGNKIVPRLLRSFMESDDWNTYVKVRGLATTARRTE